MENFALITLIEELREATRGMVVRRVVQHHSNGFLLQTRSVRIPFLKVSLDPRNPTIYVSAAKPPVESAPGDFLMVLRKHLASAQLREIDKPLSERIVWLTFKTALPAKELETVILVAELIQNAPNLYLLDGQHRILASLNKPPAHREMNEFDEYHFPKIQKTDLAGIDLTASDWFNPEDFCRDKSEWLIRNLAGVGPVLATELAHRQTVSGRALPDELNALLRQLKSPAQTAWIYSKTPLGALLKSNDVDGLRRCVLSPIELESLGSAYGVQTYPGMLEATRFLCDNIEEKALLERAKSPRLRKLRGQKRRLNQQRNRLNERQRRFEAAAGLQELAQVLVSSGVEMDHCQERVQVTDYTGDEPAPRTIELDPTRTVRDNVTRMFKKHKKADRGMKMLKGQLSELDTAERKLTKEESQIRSIGDWIGWQSFSSTPRPNQSKKDSRNSGTGAPPRVQSMRGRRKLVMDGHEVLIGRNSRENDDITFHVATGDDFWLHVADYSGSHVIVRNPSRETELDKSLLERVAQLAAYYSQARNSHKVHVHYTRRKFVKKPRRAKPGLVLLREFKTITVEPKNWTGVES